MGLSYDDFDALFSNVRREALHLEMRDSYGTEAEIPHLAKWAAGEPDDLSWLQPWCTLVRDAAKAGRTFRRARVVSEPFSDYQRWAHSLTGPMVEAGGGHPVGAPCPGLGADVPWQRLLAVR